MTREVPPDQPPRFAPVGDRPAGPGPGAPARLPTGPESGAPAQIPTAPEPAHPGPGPRGWPPGVPPPVPPPPREAWHRPRRVDPVPGTPFAVLYLDVPPITSGLSVGGLVAGVASILLSLVVVCFGLVGAGAGWGPWAAGAFALLTVLVAGAGLVLGGLARRQIGRVNPPPAVRFTGGGLALSGLICSGVGLAATLAAFALAVLLQLA